ncbi:MAG TPA: response regulator transcription factor [Vicinamibacterales bacterium]|nr:response regulator transcription factor [Vicinamibacterales bacterium]
MRLLLVEDERTTARLLARGLRESAYAVDVVHDGLAASAKLANACYDLVVLDVMLPGRSGLEVCRRLRASGETTPVLMLTARDSVDSRIDGLDAGADDYLTKPFDLGELLARIRALARRRSVAPARDRLTVGPLSIDLATRELFVSGQQVEVTAKEFGLLSYLAGRAGDVVSRQDIARHVWDDDWYDPLSNVIDVYIQRLRRKIDPAGGPSLLRARRGEGYQLIVEPCAPVRLRSDDCRRSYGETGTKRGARRPDGGRDRGPGVP